MEGKCVPGGWVLVASDEGAYEEVAAARPPSPPGMKARERKAKRWGWEVSRGDLARSVDSTSKEIGQPIGPPR